MTKNKILLFDHNSCVKIDAYLVEQKDCLKTSPSIIVCPGGGYIDLSLKEGQPVAVYLNSLGYNAFVLSYSVRNIIEKREYRWPQPLIDLGKAVIYIKNNADDLNVDKDNIYICGFSAGGHLAAMYATCWKQRLQDCFSNNVDDLRVKAVILVYPVLDLTIPASENDWRRMWEGEKPIDDFCLFMFGDANPTQSEMRGVSPVYLIDNNTFPCFIVHAQDDSVVNVLGSLKMAEELNRNKIPFSLHIFQTGEHGFALGGRSKSEMSDWVELMDKWIRENYAIE